MFELFFMLFLGGIIGCLIAQNKNFSYLAGFLWGIFLGPIFIWLLLFKNGGKKCFRCKEYVKKDAQVCKHCGHKFKVAFVKKTSLWDEYDKD